MAEEPDFLSEAILQNISTIQGQEYGSITNSKNVRGVNSAFGIFYILFLNLFHKLRPLYLVFKLCIALFLYSVTLKIPS